MNLEAISGIKQTSKACALLRQEAHELTSTESSLRAINQKLGTIINKIGAESPVFKATGKWHVQFGIDSELTSTLDEDFDTNKCDTIKIFIALKLNNWTSYCATTLNPSKDDVTAMLIEENKKTVIETCESLCPGLPHQDIESVLKLSHVDFQFINNFTNSLELMPFSGGMQRLKAGDILSINCLSTPKSGNKAAGIENKTYSHSPSAFHEETILVTANGAEILTRT